MAKKVPILKISKNSKIYAVGPDGRRLNHKLTKGDIITIKKLDVNKK